MSSEQSKQQTTESGEDGGNASPSPPQLQVTTKFLETLFDGRPVKSFEVKGGSSAGENYCSVLHTVQVSFEENDDNGNNTSTTILIKTLPAHPGRLAFMELTGFFRREYFVYNEMLPMLKAIAVNDELKLCSVPFVGGNLPGKKSIFSDGQWSNNTFIIMPDIRESDGFRNASRFNGLDFEHANLVVENLAVIHALSWVYKQRNLLVRLTDEFPLLLDFAFADEATAGQKAPFIMPIFNQGYTSAVEEVAKALGGSHPATQGLTKFLLLDGVVEKMVMFLGKAGINEDKVEELLRVKPKDDEDYIKEPWLVMTHGDCWSNNFLFKYGESTNPSKPTDVKLVDLQVVREACPTMDLTYFLTVGMRTKVRKLHEQQILRNYFEKFCHVCLVTGTGLMPGFTFDNLLRRYRRAKLFGMLMMPPLCAIMMLPKEEAEDFEETKDVGGGGDTMADLIEGTVAKGFQHKDLKEELLDVVINLYEDGIL